MALAGLTDLVDGTIARRFAQPSSFGGGLDPVVDGIFMGALGARSGVRRSVSRCGSPWWSSRATCCRPWAGAVLCSGARPVELRHTVTGQISTMLILVLVGGIVPVPRGLNLDPRPTS